MIRDWPGRGRFRNLTRLLRRGVHFPSVRKLQETSSSCHVFRQPLHVLAQDLSFIFG